VRYNLELKPEDVREFKVDEHFFSVDSLRSVELLVQLGRHYASQHVKSEHLPV
jgi:hypothetical protein